MKSNYQHKENKIFKAINYSWSWNTILLIFYWMIVNFFCQGRIFDWLPVWNLSVFDIVIILSLIASTLIYLIKRFFLKRYKHIQNNLFFLNSGSVVLLNGLLKLLGYTLLVLSFSSFLKLFITLFFISAFFLKEKREELNSKLYPKFFSWSDQKMRRLFSYSLILICISKFFGSKLKSLTASLSEKVSIKAKEFKEEIHEENYNEIKSFWLTISSKLPSLSLAMSIYDLLLRRLENALYLILLKFGNDLYNGDLSSFQSFWKEITSVKKRVEWTKMFSNFQQNASTETRQQACAGTEGFPSLCYESFLLIPNFIKADYTNSKESFQTVNIERIRELSEFIEIANREISDEDERNFIFYWIFNHINSSEELLAYRREISELKDRYSKETER